MTRESLQFLLDRVSSGEINSGEAMETLESEMFEEMDENGNTHTLIQITN